MTSTAPVLLFLYPVETRVLPGAVLASGKEHADDRPFPGLGFYRHAFIFMQYRKIQVKEAGHPTRRPRVVSTGDWLSILETFG